MEALLNLPLSKAAPGDITAPQYDEKSVRSHADTQADIHTHADTQAESHDGNILESATLLSSPQRRHGTNESKQADFTQRNERQGHLAAVTF